VNIGVDSMMVAAALNAIIAQRLVRTVCPKCVEADKPSTEAIRAWGLDPKGEHRFARGKGCSHCFGTGLRGRVGIYELLAVDEKMQAAICEGAGTEGLRAVAKRSGMADLFSEGAALASAGRTTMKEVLSVVGEERIVECGAKDE